MIRIQNEAFEAAFTPIGAELASLKDRQTGQEYIWQADPAVWASHAPVLFPIIGGLKNGQYHHQGKTYQLPKHGFIRYNSALRIERQTADGVSFLLEDNAATRLVYPFQFRFLLTYRLEGRRLVVDHQLLNTGQQTLYFSLGGHPAFRVPLLPEQGELYSDYYLAFEEAVPNWRSYTVTTEGLIGAETRALAWEENRLPLRHSLFEQDALVFKEIPEAFRRAHLCRSHAQKKEPSWQEDRVLSVAFPAFNYLGIWAKPTGDFVCIEPWLGLADAYDASGELSEKEGIQALAAGARFQAAYHIW